MSDDDDTSSSVPIEHDAAIGRVARSWGHLEYLIDLTIWEAADVEQQFGACITAQIISASYKLAALMALTRLRRCSDALLKELDTFHGGLFQTMEKRNRIVHDPRFLHVKSGSIVRWQTTAKPKAIHFGPQNETASDIDVVQEEIAKQIKRFAQLRSRIVRELQPSPENSPLHLLRVVEVEDGLG